jgi:hypothetical protein
MDGGMGQEHALGGWDREAQRLISNFVVVIFLNIFFAECCLLICTFAIPKGSTTSLKMLRRLVTAPFLQFFAMKTLGLPLVPLMSSIEQLYPLPKVQGKQHVVESIPFCEQQMECPSIDTYNKCWYQGFGLGPNFLCSSLCCMGLRSRCISLVQIQDQQNNRVDFFWSTTFQIMLLALNVTLYVFFHQYGRRENCSVPSYNHFGMLLAFPGRPNNGMLLNNLVVQPPQLGLPWWKQAPKDDKNSHDASRDNRASKGSKGSKCSKGSKMSVKKWSVQSKVDQKSKRASITSSYVQKMSGASKKAAKLEAAVKEAQRRSIELADEQKVNVEE